VPRFSIRPGHLISSWLGAQGINFPDFASDNTYVAMAGAYVFRKKGPISKVLCHLFAHLNGGANLCNRD